MSAPPGRRWGLVVVSVLAGLGVAGALATTLGDAGPVTPTAGESLDSAVVLAEDPPAPPSPSPRPTPLSEPPGVRVDVICSDLSIRSVPTDLLSTDEPGELVELANGTCVVMDPNGVVAP